MQNILRRSSLALALVAAASLLTACGASVCDRSEEVGKTLQSKAGDCEVTTTMAPRAACDANIGSCSGDDQDKIHKMLDCMEGISTCSAGNELAWMGEFAACGSHVQGVSAECQKAFSQE